MSSRYSAVIERLRRKRAGKGQLKTLLASTWIQKRSTTIRIRRGEGLPFESSIISDWAKLRIQRGVAGACGLRSGEGADAQRRYSILTPVLSVRE